MSSWACTVCGTRSPVDKVKRLVFKVAGELEELLANSQATLQVKSYKQNNFIFHNGYVCYGWGGGAKPVSAKFFIGGKKLGIYKKEPLRYL